MTPGQERFEHYLVQLETLLAQAGEENNPALWLYENDARTCAFMLQALSRLYLKMHDKKKFSKILSSSKQIEDLLGAIDYYDSFRKMFVTNVNVPVTVPAFLQDARDEKMKTLNQFLIVEKWIGPKAKQTNKIRKLLKKADWLSEKNEVEAIKKRFNEEIDRILMFARETDNGFTELEDQVHEMRRKLRWLSIYAKALQGLVQLDDTTEPDAVLSVYLTPETVNSSFNKMAEPKSNRYALILERNYFYALSWVIARLGIIKDDGLKMFALTEALQETENISPLAANEIAFEVLNKNEDYLQGILNDASTVVQNFINEGYLKKLIIGIRKL